MKRFLLAVVMVVLCAGVAGAIGELDLLFFDCAHGGCHPKQFVNIGTTVTINAPMYPEFSTFGSGLKLTDDPTGNGQWTFKNLSTGDVYFSGTFDTFHDGSNLIMRLFYFNTGVPFMLCDPYGLCSTPDGNVIVLVLYGEID